MKKITTTAALLAILALCLSALTTATASAAEWLCNKLAVTKEKECLVLGGNLSVGLLNDMTASSEIECPVESVLGEGWVGPGAAGELTSVTLVESGKNCKPTATAENLKGEQVANTCKKVVKIAAENLPWTSKLETIKEVLWDTVKGKGAGTEPAYAIECEVAGGIKINDLCEANSAAPGLVLVNNLAADEESPKLPLVDILPLLKTFEETEKSATPEAEWGNCTIGKEHSALVEGELLLEAFIKEAAVALEAK